MLLFGLALVLMMLFRPAGLWPSKTRRRELSAAEDTLADEKSRAS
jgi:branched-chain amino acid transport system permease protein